LCPENAPRPTLAGKAVTHRHSNGFLVGRCSKLATAAGCGSRSHVRWMERLFWRL